MDFLNCYAFLFENVNHLGEIGLTNEEVLTAT